MTQASRIHLNPDSPPIEVPSGYTGPVTLPGNGKTVWWTGRVAIGLRHQAQRYSDATSQSALWIQNLLLGDHRRERAAA